MARIADIKRKTNETEINIKINLDGKGVSSVATGIGFFDHMLCHVSKQSFVDLDINAVGDTFVDCHHTVEDVGICLGKAMFTALGSKECINRYGDCTIPMDEALVLCSIDISGRPYLNFDVQFSQQSVGNMDTEMVEEFFRAVCINGGINMHIKLFYGKNNHHISECIFKAFGRALGEAIKIHPHIEGVLSTKGMLE